MKEWKDILIAVVITMVPMIISFMIAIGICLLVMQAGGH